MPEPTESHSVWGAWIEMVESRKLSPWPMSHSVWGAWIEITAIVDELSSHEVALRMGCVD